ncbi:hypothetical protein [Streptomyces lomondensis]|uniref:Uncharacterized protein n=1 Tax=Streptomyces lomondensis TaxID=68229 RepID=A0ABQ2XAW0_9ACTN|nr:hypothetical protein [Streptomyces lomondensis]MCF0077053.1 hypothetical protein [Streptomyces lomondensis]GGX07081.1 hypothetical protein GCM10010383_41450 [Streptomyces lomondensis]
MPKVDPWPSRDGASSGTTAHPPGTMTTARTEQLGTAENIDSTAEGQIVKYVGGGGLLALVIGLLLVLAFKSSQTRPNFVWVQGVSGGSRATTGHAPARHGSGRQTARAWNLGGDSDVGRVHETRDFLNSTVDGGYRVRHGNGRRGKKAEERDDSECVTAVRDMNFFRNDGSCPQPARICVPGSLRHPNECGESILYSRLANG